MKPSEPKVQPPARDEPSDPPAPAEGLRDALAIAAAKAARLVGVPRPSRKEKRALVTIPTTLKQLNPANGGRP